MYQIPAIQKFPSLTDGLVFAAPMLGYTGSRLIPARFTEYGTFTNLTGPNGWNRSSLGWALNFGSGTTEHVRFNRSLEIGSVHTFSFWMNGAGVPVSNTDIQFVMACREAFATFDWQIFWGNGVLYKMEYWSKSGLQFSSGVLPTLNTWQHWVMRSSAANSHQWFLDGVQVATSSTSDTPPASSDDFSIGKSVQSAASLRSANAKIGPIFIYDRALSDTEIQTLYRHPRAPVEQLRRTVSFVPAGGGGTNYSDIFGSTIFGGSVVA